MGADVEVSQTVLPYWIGHRKVIVRIAKPEVGSGLAATGHRRCNMPTKLMRLYNAKGGADRVFHQFGVLNSIASVAEDVGARMHDPAEETTDLRTRSFSQPLPSTSGESPVLRLIRRRSRRRDFHPKVIEDRGLRPVCQDIVLWVQTPVGVWSNRTDPFPRGGDTRDTATAHLPRVGKAGELHQRHGEALLLKDGRL
jgi:hypothetical protein